MFLLVSPFSGVLYAAEDVGGSQDSMSWSTLVFLGVFTSGLFYTLFVVLMDTTVSMDVTILSEVVPVALSDSPEVVRNSMVACVPSLDSIFSLHLPPDIISSVSVLPNVPLLPAFSPPDISAFSDPLTCEQAKNLLLWGYFAPEAEVRHGVIACLHCFPAAFFRPVAALTVSEWALNCGEGTSALRHWIVNSPAACRLPIDFTPGLNDPFGLIYVSLVRRVVYDHPAFFDVVRILTGISV